MIAAAYAPTIYQGPTWWQILLLTTAGGIIALLAADGWAWLVDRWTSRPLSGTTDTTADDPERPDYDTQWRAQGRVPSRPTHLVARWVTTRHGLHYSGCRYARNGDPLPNAYTVEVAAAAADERALRPCHVCKPLADLDEAGITPIPQDVTA